MVCRVAGAFGVRGEVRLTTFTADPLSVVDYRTLLREDGSPGLTLLGGRVAKDAVIVRAEQVGTREQAEALRGLKLFIRRDSLPPVDGDDEYYVADLVGLAVDDPAGQPIGRVKSVHDFGAGDLLEIEPPAGPSWWQPFTREAVPVVNMAERRIVAIRPEETE